MSFANSPVHRAAPKLKLKLKLKAQPLPLGATTYAKAGAFAYALCPAAGTAIGRPPERTLRSGIKQVPCGSLIRCRTRLKKWLLVSGLADVDYGGILELVFAEANDALTRLVIQRLQGFVDNQPARLMQQGTSENQPFLLVIGEFPFPARDAIERRGKTVQACGLERSYEFLVFVGHLGGGIGQRCAQAFPAAHRAGAS